jgi:hypothetical protein
MASTISNDLAAQMQQLATLQNDKNLSAEDKKKALEVAGAKTLAEINAEIPSLNFTSTKFAEKIAKIITEGNWNQLPNPEKLSITIHDLNIVASAVETASNSMSVDMTSIMRLLTEAYGKLATIKSNENTQNRTLRLKAADKEFEARDKENREQLAANLVSAAADIVGGVIQGAGAIYALKGALKNAGKSKDLLKESHQLSGITQQKNNKKIELDNVKLEIKTTKPGILKKMEKLQADIDSPSTTPQQKIDAKTKFDKFKNNLDALENKKNGFTKEFNDLSIKETGLSNKISIENEEIKASNQKYEGRQQIINSSATISKGFVQGTSAILTFTASTTRLEADKSGLVKDLAAQAEQSAQEAYRNANEGFRSANQSLSAMMQSLDASASHMAKA